MFFFRFGASQIIYSGGWRCDKRILYSPDGNIVMTTFTYPPKFLVNLLLVFKDFISIVNFVPPEQQQETNYHKTANVIHFKCSQKCLKGVMS